MASTRDGDTSGRVCLEEGVREGVLVVLEEGVAARVRGRHVIVAGVAIAARAVLALILGAARVPPPGPLRRLLLLPVTTRGLA